MAQSRSPLTLAEVKLSKENEEGKNFPEEQAKRLKTLDEAIIAAIAEDENAEEEALATNIVEWQQAFAAQASLGGHRQSYGLSTHSKHPWLDSWNALYTDKYKVEQIEGGAKYTLSQWSQVKPAHFTQLYIYAVEKGGRDKKRTINFSKSKCYQAFAMMGASLAQCANPPQLKVHDGKYLAQRLENDEFIYENYLDSTLLKLNPTRQNFKPYGPDLRKLLGSDNMMQKSLGAVTPNDEARLINAYHRVNHAAYKLAEISSVYKAQAVLGIYQQIAQEIDDGTEPDANIQEGLGNDNTHASDINWAKAHQREVFGNPDESAEQKREFFKNREARITEKLKQNSAIENMGFVNAAGEFKAGFEDAIKPLLHAKAKEINQHGIVEPVEQNGVNAHVIRGAMTEAGISHVPEVLQELNAERQGKPLYYLKDKQTNNQNVAIDLTSFSGLYDKDVSDHDKYAYAQVKDYLKPLRWSDNFSDSYKRETYFGVKQNNFYKDTNKVKEKLKNRESAITLSNQFVAIDQAARDVFPGEGLETNIQNEIIKELKKEYCQKEQETLKTLVKEEYLKSTSDDIASIEEQLEAAEADYNKNWSVDKILKNAGIDNAEKIQTIKDTMINEDGTIKDDFENLGKRAEDKEKFKKCMKEHNQKMEKINTLKEKKELIKRKPEIKKKINEKVVQKIQEAEEKASTQAKKIEAKTPVSKGVPLVAAGTQPGSNK